ncbi:MAG: hypothetical protein L0Z62_23745, partial [Gemmataceae bacterium]|nr:hypothetical protein [Gemmataceae bacterium]
GVTGPQPRYRTLKNALAWQGDTGEVMSKRVYLLGVGLALVALAFLITDAATRPRQGPTEANLRRVRAGMTLAEVQAILGPQGQVCYAPGASGSRGGVYLWGGPGGTALVIVGRGGGVESAGFQRAAVPSPLDRLRAWLGW